MHQLHEPWTANVIGRMHRYGISQTELERKTNDLEDLVKRQQIALELYSEKLAKVEVDVDLLKKGVKLWRLITWQRKNY